MDFLIRFLVIAGIACGFALILIYFAVVCKVKCYPIKNIVDVVAGILLPIFAVGIFVLSIVSYSTITNQDKQAFYDKIREYVNEQGYTIYIDGAEVDLEHITIEQYLRQNIVVEKEIKEIHITRGN